MTVLTLIISEPKTSVHLTPSLEDVREIQVVDFVRVRKPFVRKQDMPQHVFKVEDDGSDTELLRFNVGDHCPIEEIQSSFKRLNKGFGIIDVDGDLYLKSSGKIYSPRGFTQNSDCQKFLKRANLTLC